MSRQPHRLEHTRYVPSTGQVFHYTCNAPSIDTLATHGIQPIGDSFGADAREVLLIPSELYDRFGYKIRESDLVATSETLLRRLD